LQRSSRRTPAGKARREGRLSRGASTAAGSPHVVRHAGAALVALAALPLGASGCSLAIDVDDYQFRSVDAGQEPAPLLPAVEDAGRAPVRSPPAPPDPVEAKPLPPTPPPPDAGTPPAPPPEALPPEPPRPVALGEPGPVIQLAGNPTGGGARAADCPDGVLAGFYYRFFTDTGVFPSRLSFLAPICAAVEPTAPVLAFGGITETRWLDITTGESLALPPLRETEQEASVFCPGDEVVVGSGATFDSPVDTSVAFRTLTLQCATLGSDLERVDIVQGPLTEYAAPGLSPTLGAFSVVQPCPPGTAATALELRSGSWLDTYGLRCSLVRWPFAAGHACTLGSDCQSQSCGVTATCDP